LGASRATQSEAIKPQDALQVCEPHLDLLALTSRLAECLVKAHHSLAVDQKRMRLDAERSVNNCRKRSRPVMAVACEAADARTISR
jgi:hypothetical protein